MSTGPLSTSNGEDTPEPKHVAANKQVGQKEKFRRLSNPPVQTFESVRVLLSELIHISPA